MGREIALALLLLGSLPSACSAPKRVPSEASAPSARLADGLYAVISETTDAPRPEAAPNQRHLLYDPRRADPSSNEPRRDVTVETTGFVPLVLGAAPAATAQEDGRLLVQVALADRHVRTLADFTRDHVGGKAALVLDGEVLSVHKLRAVIEDGRMQITRCTDRACERILSKLVERSEAGARR